MCYNSGYLLEDTMNRFVSITNMLASSDSAMPSWVVTSFPVIKIVLAVLICICAIALIVLVLCQKTESEGGVNAITGQADTFYNRNKGESLQGKVKKATIAFAVMIFVFCVAFLIINSIYRGY